MKNVVLGMAIQSATTGLFAVTGFINFRPGQQLFATVFFILLFLLLKKSKNKENQEK